jgi:hypothetical protein
VAAQPRQFTLFVIFLGDRNGLFPLHADLAAKVGVESDLTSQE